MAGENKETKLDWEYDAAVIHISLPEGNGNKQHSEYTDVYRISDSGLDSVKNTPVCEYTSA